MRIKIGSFFMLLGLLVLVAANTFAASTAIEQANLNYYNQLKNPGAENGLVDYTASGGSLTRVTGSSALLGTSSLSWDASTTSQTLQTGLYSSQPGTINGPCVASFQYKYENSSNQPTVQVLDGSGNTLSALITLNTTQSTRPQRSVVPFACPNSPTQYRLRFTSTGNADALIVDDLYMGVDNRNYSASQATFYGSLKYNATANCEWTSSGSSWTSFPADTDCPTADVDGRVTAPGTKIPGFVVSEPGDYLVMAVGARFMTTSASDGNSTFRLSDGTIHSTADFRPLVNATGGALSSHGLGTFRFSKTNNAASTFNLQQDAANATLSLNNTNTSLDGAGLTFLVYRYPLSQDSGLRVDQLGWKVDANISGANPSLGTGAVSSYSGITDGSLTLTNNPGFGNISCMIPCSSTNGPTGTTCSAGTESLGISCNFPAGEVLACASFSHRINSGGGTLSGTFQIVETPSNAQTILQEGKGRPISGFNGTGIITFPHRVCGLLSFPTATQRTLRLMYEQLSSGSLTASEILADADSSTGQRDVHWEVYPLNYLSGAMPILDGLVSHSGSGREHHNSAIVAYSAKCTSSPCTISSQSGSWLSSVSRNTTGDYSLNLNSGVCSSMPRCRVTSLLLGTANGTCTMRNTNGSSTRRDLVCFNTSGSAQDDGFEVSCDCPN